MTAANTPQQQPKEHDGDFIVSGILLDRMMTNSDNYELLALLFSRPHPAPQAPDEDTVTMPRYVFEMFTKEKRPSGYTVKERAELGIITFGKYSMAEHDAAIARKTREQVLDEANKELDSDECPPSVDPKDCEGDCVRCILNTLRHST